LQVRMPDGSYRNFNYGTQPNVQVGERVHVYGDSLSASYARGEAEGTTPYKRLPG
jgi:hypothetical protein